MNSLKLSTNRIAILSLALAVLVGVCGMSKSTESKSVGNPRPLTGSRVPISPQGGSQTVRVLRVFVHPDDIYPHEIHLKPGLIRLRAENESVRDISLVLDFTPVGESVQRVAAVRTLHRDKRVEQVVSLSKGEYFYYEESMPNIRGRIIVDAE